MDEMNNFDINVKVALLQKDIELLKIQTADLADYRRELKDQIVAVKFKQDSLENSIQSLKERLDEKFTILLEDQKEINGEQRETTISIRQLNASLTALNTKIDAATAHSSSQAATTASKGKIEFSEGFWSLLLRVFLILASLAAGILGLPALTTGGE